MGLDLWKPRRRFCPACGTDITCLSCLGNGHPKPEGDCTCDSYMKMNRNDPPEPLDLITIQAKSILDRAGIKTYCQVCGGLESGRNLQFRCFDCDGTGEELGHVCPPPQRPLSQAELGASIDRKLNSIISAYPEHADPPRRRQLSVAGMIGKVLTVLFWIVIGIPCGLVVLYFGLIELLDMIR